jgi:2-keto-4-pentenoate hydratase
MAQPSTTASVDPIAERFVAARLAGAALPEYPGAMPTTMDEAYRIQDQAISVWPDEIAGWKIGLIAPARRADFDGHERLTGPAFKKAVRFVTPGETYPMPIFRDGFGAVEGEFMAVIGEDAPADKTEWTSEEAAALVSALHIGIEPASSPFPGINDHGPAVTASDFGNNAGLLVGPAIENWRSLDMASISVETVINGEVIGRGTGMSVPGGPMGALAYLLGLMAKRGRPLKAGEIITTGAATGVHQVQIGDRCHVDFAGYGRLHVDVVAQEAKA